MSEAKALAFSFAFERPLDRWARGFGVVPTRCYVRLDARGVEAVYGPWRVATAWSNFLPACAASRSERRRCRAMGSS